MMSDNNINRMSGQLGRVFGPGGQHIKVSKSAAEPAKGIERAERSDIPELNAPSGISVSPASVAGLAKIRSKQADLPGLGSEIIVDDPHAHLSREELSLLRRLAQASYLDEGSSIYTPAAARALFAEPAPVQNINSPDFLSATASHLDRASRRPSH